MRKMRIACGNEWWHYSLSVIAEFSVLWFTVILLFVMERPYMHVMKDLSEFEETAEKHTSKTISVDGRIKTTHFDGCINYVSVMFACMYHEISVVDPVLSCLQLTLFWGKNASWEVFLHRIQLLVTLIACLIIIIPVHCMMSFIQNLLVFFHWTKFECS